MMATTPQAMKENGDSTSHKKLNMHQNLSDRMDLKTTLVLHVVKSIVAVYGVLTLPVYFLLQRPWQVWKAEKAIWGHQIQDSDPYSPWTGVRPKTNTLKAVRTMDDLFRWCVHHYRERRHCGYREILAEIDFYQGKEKAIKKFQLGDYKWCTYAEMEQRVDSLCNAMMRLGVQPKKPVLILAETRMEWMLILNSCFRLNIPVATLFANIGAEGIVHGINETEVSFIFTSQDCLPKLKDIIGSTPTVRHIVYMESLRPVQKDGFPDSVEILTLKKLEEMGRMCEAGGRPRPPTADDVAVLMYTSGSTGTPKGVIMSHKNLVAIVSNCIDGIKPIHPDDLYIAYLPLAHAFELVTEFFLSSLGVAIGYSSPFTLTDKSTGIMEGCKGDSSLLRPQLMTFVPLMLDKIRKSVCDVLAQKSVLAQEFFRYAMDYKVFWYNKGFGTPILNVLLFNKIKSMLGGRVKVMVGGGAPLSPDTYEFVKMILDAPIMQAYGMTETSSGITIMTNTDRSKGRVGAPFGTGLIRLVDWSEGNYFVTDAPNPRGEIVIGGDAVTMGYFKNEALTNECFEEKDGVRWVHSGDIGEIYPDGTLKIIDRKKDLVKLKNGEYISLGKVEAELKTCPLVDNVCVVGNSYHDYLVALVLPNFPQLLNLAKKMNKDNMPDSELCDNLDIIAVSTSIIRDHAVKSKLQRIEIPKKVKLCAEEWLPQNGLVTAALKIRRKAIEDFYKFSLADMYEVDL